MFSGSAWMANNRHFRLKRSGRCWLFIQKPNNFGVYDSPPSNQNITNLTFQVLNERLTIATFDSQKMEVVADSFWNMFMILHLTVNIIGIKVFRFWMNVEQPLRTHKKWKLPIIQNPESVAVYNSPPSTSDRMKLTLQVSWCMINNAI